VFAFLRRACLLAVVVTGLAACESGISHALHEASLVALVCFQCMSAGEYMIFVCDYLQYPSRSQLGSPRVFEEMYEGFRWISMHVLHIK
jgi:hypothetical protein